jgi:uncharacterized protein YcsI (UPF0317 family)
MLAATNSLKDVRSQIRSGGFQNNTSGLMPNLVQGNLVIMPKQWADEFIEFCRLNPKPCPLIGISKPGDPAIPELGDGLDIRIDVPEYHLFRDGAYSSAVSDISDYWQDDSVAIVLGCSFSFEDALQSAGLPVKNIAQGTNVSMYDTNIATIATDNFNCNMVVSMRPFKKHNIDQVISITNEFPKAHGAPVHIGDPSLIGIKDIHSPEYGSPVVLEDDDIPVFWACGVTTQAAIRSAKLPLVITHAPGKMLITDHMYKDLGSITF